MSTCQGPECTRPVRARGLCNGHYEQQRRGWRNLQPIATAPAALPDTWNDPTPPPAPAASGSGHILPDVGVVPPTDVDVLRRVRDLLAAHGADDLVECVIGADDMARLEAS